MKRLVMCTDGTWNKADQARNGKPCPTNVCKLSQAVAERDPTGVEQRVSYRAGVGTSKGERLLGGAFGYGLSREVQENYRFLVQNYEEGDELFFFGFSRGAYTARSTVGLVRKAGILRRDEEDRIEEAYALYRDKDTKPNDPKATAFRDAYASETRVRFIGVWDTVGALGIPLSGLRLVNLVNRRWQFHDTEISSWVDAAVQALAVDEKRGPFQPTVWKKQDHAGGQLLEQVWFAGVHSDVGGGYADSSLADVTLHWMMDRAAGCGLAFDDRPEVDLTTSALGRMHDSYGGFYKLTKPSPRRLGAECPASESLASTALARHRGTDYRPPCLVAYLDGDAQITDI